MIHGLPGHSTQIITVEVKGDEETSREESGGYWK